MSFSKITSIHKDSTYCKEVVAIGAERCTTFIPEMHGSRHCELLLHTQVPQRQEGNLSLNDFKSRFLQSI
jgi:hypothetical protein